MAQHKVVVCCWSHGHETELSMTRLQEEKLAKQIPKLKAVCPTCRESDNGNQAIFIKHGDTVFGSHKTFVCRHGHTSLVSPFSSGMLHIRFGPGEDDFTNIKGTIEELEELIDNKDITCYHTKVNNQACGCKLKAVDSSSLSYPETVGIKTKTRLGDLWDRAGAEPVRNGSYDADGNWSTSRTEKANLERLKNMRKGNRITPEK